MSEEAFSTPSVPPKKQAGEPWVVPPSVKSVTVVSSSRSERSPERAKSSKKVAKSTPVSSTGRRPPTWAQVQAALDGPSKKLLKELLDAFPLETVSLQHENGMTALHFACSGDMFEHVRLLLDKGARPNARDEDGWTPLHFACQAGSSDIVLLLLNHGAHPTVTNSIEQTALHVAASNGRKEVVTVLLDSAEGSKLVGMLDGNGATPLLWAASAGNLYVVRLLLEKGSPDLVSLPLTRSVDGIGGGVFGSGANCAMVAAISGFPKVMELMLDAGVNLHATDVEGRNILHYASLCATSGVEVVQTLMRRPESAQLLNAVDESGNSHLHLAASSGDVGLLKHLQHLMKSANMPIAYSKTNYLGCNLLHMAVQVEEKHNSDMVNHLLDEDPTLIAAKDNRGQSPLHIACNFLNFGSAFALVNYESCTREVLSLLDHRGRSCMHCIAARDSAASSLDDIVVKVLDCMLAICPELIAMGDAEKNTPLHFAASMGNRIVLRALLSSPHCTDEVVAAENLLGLTARKCLKNGALLRLFYPSNRTRIRSHKKRSDLKSDPKVEAVDEEDEDEGNDEEEEAPPPPTVGGSGSKSSKKTQRKRPRTEVENLADAETDDHLRLLKFLKESLKVRMDGLRNELKEVESMIKDRKSRKRKDEPDNE